MLLVRKLLVQKLFLVRVFQELFFLDFHSLITQTKFFFFLNESILLPLKFPVVFLFLLCFPIARGVFFLARSSAQALDAQNRFQV